MGAGCAAYGASEATRTGWGLFGLGLFVVVLGLGFIVKTAIRPWAARALAWIETEPVEIVWVYPRQKGTESSLVVCRRDGSDASIPLNLQANVEAVLHALREGPLPHARFGYREDWALEFHRNPGQF